MKAVRINEFGGVEVLKIEEIERPALRGGRIVGQSLRERREPDGLGNS